MKNPRKMITGVRSHNRRTPSGKVVRVKKHDRQINVGDRFLLPGNRTFTVKNKPFTSGGQKFYSGTSTTPRNKIEVPETVNKKKLVNQLDDNPTDTGLPDGWEDMNSRTWGGTSNGLVVSGFVDNKRRVFVWKRQPTGNTTGTIDVWGENRNTGEAGIFRKSFPNTIEGNKEASKYAKTLMKNFPASYSD